MSNNISFQAVETKKLSDLDIKQIFNIEQDMWARKEGLWEYMECESCWALYSKQDIYWDLEKSIYNKTVSELENNEWRDIFCCSACWGKNTHCFSEKDYTKSMRERYSLRSTLVLMYDDKKLIWFMDGYVSWLEDIYSREFAEHYSDIGIDKIKEAIYTTLWYLPDEYFSCASSWTREGYMNFFHIYNLLQNFFLHFPSHMEEVTWLSELHSGWPYSKIFWKLWTRSIGLREKHKESIQSSNSYDSDIYVHPNFWKSCKKAFKNKSVRSFIQAHK